MFCQCPVEIIANHTCLNMGIAILNANLQNSIHPGKVNDDSTFDRDHSTAETCTRSSRDNRDLMLVGKLDNFSYLLG